MKRRTGGTPLYKFLRATFGPYIESHFNLRAVGLDNLPEEPVILAANQGRNWDGGAVATQIAKKRRALRAIAKEAPLKYGGIITNYFLKALGCAPLPEDPRIALRNVVPYAERILQEARDDLLIFPERRRVEGEYLEPFQTGAAKIAIKTKTPIVPVFLDLYRTGRVEFGEALYPNGDKSKNGVRELTKRVEDSVFEMSGYPTRYMPN